MAVVAVGVARTVCQSAPGDVDRASHMESTSASYDHLMKGLLH